MRTRLRVDDVIGRVFRSRCLVVFIESQEASRLVHHCLHIAMSKICVSLSHEIAIRIKNSLEDTIAIHIHQHEWYAIRRMRHHSLHFVAGLIISRGKAVYLHDGRSIDVILVDFLGMGNLLCHFLRSIASRRMIRLLRMTWIL